MAVSFANLAEPLEVLANDERLAAALAALVREYQVKQLLVGLSEGEMANETRRFAQDIAQVLVLPLFFADETLTSAAAQTKRAWLAGKAKRRMALDHLAAAEILQQWLETEVRP